MIQKFSKLLLNWIHTFQINIYFRICILYYSNFLLLYRLMLFSIWKGFYYFVCSWYIFVNFHAKSKMFFEWLQKDKFLTTLLEKLSFVISWWTNDHEKYIYDSIYVPVSLYSNTLFSLHIIYILRYTSDSSVILLVVYST